MVNFPRKNRWNISASSKGLWLIVCVFFVFIASCYHSLFFHNPDKPGCAMSYMYQSYAKLKSFDTQHTRLANRYSLYLYRDAKYDITPDADFKPDGVPVIFIPGNAGSYRQVRSIASLAAEISASPGNNNTKLDFYTMDFQEDFTAFHGRTLLDQAEYVNDAIKYILQLYDKESPDVPHPKSVIVIGHSMGGFIARSLVVLDNYVPESINTIVTLAAPHTIPPLTFDSYMTDIYTKVNNYWAESFSKINLDRNPLSSIALISIAGGKNDNMIHSDSTMVSPISSPSNAFAVLSSSIPGVWTSIDHLAIVWCHQCRTALVNALFEIIDPQSHSKTRSLKDRMTVFAKHLLSGFEPYNYNALQKRLKLSGETIIKADEHSTFVSSGSKLSQYTPAKKLYLAPINKNNGLLSHIYDDPESKISYFLCKALSAEKYHNKDIKFDLDVSTQGSKELFYSCAGLDSTHSVSVPYSKKGNHEPFESGFVPNVGLKSARYYLFNNSRDFSDYEYIAAIPSKSASVETTLVAINSGFSNTDVEIKASNFALMVRGAQVRLRPLEFVDISITKATSGLVSYKVSVDSKKECETNPNLSFFMRQYVLEPFESKWYVNIGNSRPLYVSFHGLASPFTPNSGGNLHLQVFSPMFNDMDEKCGPVTVSITVDIWGSLANFVIRYRTLLVSFAMSIASTVVLVQLFYYFKTSQFVSFSSGLKFLVSKLPLIVPCLTVVHLLVSFESLRNILHFFALHTFLLLTGSKKVQYLEPFRQNDMFIGQSQFELWFIGPLAYIVSIGFVSLVYAFTVYPISTITKLLAAQNKKYPSTQSKKPEQVNDRQNGKHNGKQMAKQNDKQSIFLISSGLIVSALTVTILPYTIGLFLGLICILVYYTKASFYFYSKLENTNTNNLTELQKEKSEDVRNDSTLFAQIYLIESFTILLLLSLIPVGVPIFIAWMHQGIEHSFFAKFSSHHNIFHLLPMALAILSMKKLLFNIKTFTFEKSSAAQTPSFLISKFWVYSGLVVLSYTSIFSLLFGFLYSYSLQTFALLFSVLIFGVVYSK